MVTMGLSSLIFASFMLYRRRDIKRLFAYSSIEHMGIITFAFGMGGPLANFAGLLHMTMHSLTKSAIFFAVGNIAQAKGTQKIADIRGLTESHPVLGWGLVVGVVAIAGLPPLGIFMSEFLVVTSTFARQPLLAIPLVLGLLVAFGALLWRVAASPSARRPARWSRSRHPMCRCSCIWRWCCARDSICRRRWSPGSSMSRSCWDDAMSALGDILDTGRHIEAHRPWPRAIVDARGWELATVLAADGRCTLLGLWGEKDAVHMALAVQDPLEIAVLSLPCPDGAFPSVGRHHPPAIRLERTIRDLFGLVPQGAVDARPWLDHGRWGKRRPLGDAQADAGAGEPYAFLPVEGESLHQIPVGPVHAGIIEPGHFRFTANGETVVRLEERLGYVHKGIEGLMAGAEIAQAARLAGRVSGDSTVAYAAAFAQAVEAALGVTAPPRAQWLRALMIELERLANHLGDIGAICNDASFAIMLAHCGILRERVLRAADAAFGHRLMRDRVVPGGVAADLADAGIDAIRSLLREIRARFPTLVQLYDRTTSLQDRTVATGSLGATLARQFGAGGYVGRASGRAFDARAICRRRCPTASSASRSRAHRRRCERAHLGAHRRGDAEPGADRADSRTFARRRYARRTAERRRGARRHGDRRRLSRRHPGVAAPRRRRPHRALPSARPVLVPMAAAGGGDRRQHRRRLPALQQKLQLLLFGSRSLRRMR